MNQKKTDNKAVHCYAVRRVNPFRGVMQIIESSEGRAMSCNGIVWEIQVRATQVCSTRVSIEDDCDNEKVKKTFYRFGMWSMKDGLMKRSNSPVDDQDYFELSSKCDALTGYLVEYCKLLPFTLEENLELWLFDKDSLQPLVLLSSVTHGANLPSPEPEYWSACIGPGGTSSQHRFPRADDLEAMVKQRAGDCIHKHWVRRLADGNGVMETTGETIPAKLLPALLLDENWMDKQQKQCVSDYIRWISPSLLTLQHLDMATRVRIENSLNVQAISIEHHWHLYPEVIDQKLLNAARVQNKIEQSG